MTPDTADVTPATESNPAAFVASAIGSISSEILREVCRHAVESYPDECCGTIGIAGVRRCDNTRRSSDTPGDARQVFELDAAGAIALAESAGRTGAIRVIYHSHPDGPAVFSEIDSLGAAPKGIPLYPEICHLVLSCDAGSVSEARLYAYQAGAFAECTAWPRAVLQEILA